MGIESIVADAVMPGSGEALKALGFIRRHGPGILIGIAAIALLGLLYWAPWAVSRGAHSRDAEVAGLQKTIADMKAAEAKAKAEEEAKARGIEAAQQAAKEGTTHEIENNRADAARLLDAYIAKLHTASARTASGQPVGAGEAASAGAGSGQAAAGGGGLSVMDDGDLRVCTENTVKALGWRSWWTKIQAIPR